MLVSECNSLHMQLVFGGVMEQLSVAIITFTQNVNVY